MKMGYILIIVGIAFLLAGGLLVCCKKESKQEVISRSASLHQDEDRDSQQAAQDPEPAPQVEKSAKQKGNDFEGYIADIITQNGITVKKWNQGAVSPQGNMADDAKDPDFFVSQPHDTTGLEYWIEAKWRKSCGEVFALKQEQFARYKAKQRESKRKIIVAIGVGGSPDKPKSVYFVPLDSMPDGKISVGQMRHYFLSNPGRDFKNRMERWFRNEVFNKKK